MYETALKTGEHTPSMACIKANFKWNSPKVKDGQHEEHPVPNNENTQIWMQHEPRRVLREDKRFGCYDNFAKKVDKHRHLHPFSLARCFIKPHLLHAQSSADYNIIFDNNAFLTLGFTQRFTYGNAFSHQYASYDATVC
jgi:hypothetical protein